MNLYGVEKYMVLFSGEWSHENNAYQKYISNFQICKLSIMNVYF